MPNLGHLWGAARLLGSGLFAALNAQGAVDEFGKTREALKRGDSKNALGHGVLTAANAFMAPAMATSAMKNLLLLQSYGKTKALVDAAKRLGPAFNGQNLDEAVKAAKAAGQVREPRFSHATTYLSNLSAKNQLPSALSGHMKEVETALGPYHNMNYYADKIEKALTPNFIQQFHKDVNKWADKVPVVGPAAAASIGIAPFIIGEQLVSDSPDAKLT